MSARNGNGKILWRGWSKEAFDEAAAQKKLIILDLTASWCHWCHVMDSTSYSDSDVIRLVNENFIPIRVDIDRRPDISERYNRGGFPTTAFLSDQGESVWGATYLPPADMKRIIDSILRAKASGEIDAALERSRMPYLDISKPSSEPSSVRSVNLASLFEDVFAAYDVEYGGFGSEPKFPNPDAIDLLLDRYAVQNDQELGEAVENTLDRIADGLYDPVEGGIFRYSVTRDWKVPHYEKMLETNTGFLRNLVRANNLLGNKRYGDLARGVASYLLSTLRDASTGGFFGSQDADEEYYKLPEKGRRNRTPPSIDKTIFAGWNAEASATLVEAGVLMGEQDWVDAGRSAFYFSSRNLWNAKMGLVRHTVGQELYMFEDQAGFLVSLVSALELSPDKELFEIGDKLLEGVERRFANPEGGYSDVAPGAEDLGELQNPRRSLIANAKWARLIALYGAATRRHELEDQAKKVLLSFTTKEVEACGVFAAPYLYAWSALERGPALVDIHSQTALDAASIRLWISAKENSGPGVVAMVSKDTNSKIDEPFAILCTRSGCSERITNPRDLADRLRRYRAGKG
jgi:hypothetical protein